MKKSLYEYKERIMKLPIKNKYTKEELLKDDFLVDKDKNLEIYYAPHNEYLNPKAKIFIVGITPGFQQMSTAISTARKELEESDNIEEIQYKCKVAGRFSGTLRKNIILMLDQLHIGKALGINEASELFGDNDYLLHTVSLIPYSVFYKGENYSGHTPKLLKSDFLMKYVNENFIDEFNKLDNPDKILIVPLGRAVEDVLIKLAEEGIIDYEQILKGFPHPSGANVNMKKQFEENKNQLIEKVKEFL